MTLNPDDEMRVLTLWQPWASAMALGLKKVETRPIRWAYRGWLAINASGNRTAIKQGTTATIRHAFHTKGVEQITALPVAAILCLVWVDNVLPVEAANLVEPWATKWDLAFGDYSPGRFAYFTSGLKVLPTPIPWKGKQGLQHVTQTLRDQIAKALA